MVRKWHALESEGGARQSGVPVILMHMRGEPKTMQADPAKLVYADVVGEIIEFLQQRLTFATGAGISREHLAVDPGIGFGKTDWQNIEIIAHLDAFASLGVPVVLGASRKRLLGAMSGRSDTRHRLGGSLACAAAAALAGVHIIRAHDVAETVAAARFATALRDARGVDSAAQRGGRTA